MSLESNMDKVLARRVEIEDQLSQSANLSSDELTKLSRELSEVRPVAEQIEKVRALETALEDATQLATESASDAEMLEMAEMEIAELSSQIPEEEHALKLLLLPKDADDARNAILKCALVQAVMKRPCLQVIYLACINACPRAMAGVLK